MIFLILLLLLGIYAYLIVWRSFSQLTRTPVWLLWLVMMMPALVLMGWAIANGDNQKSFPIPLLLALLILCPLLFWFLIQLGRISPEQIQQFQEQQQREIAEKLAEKRPKVRPINREEEASLRHCFPWTVYYLQNLEYRPQAVICRGQLRSSPEIAYRTIRDNIEAQFGDRFLVVFQEGNNRKPFFALVPNPQKQQAKSAKAQQLTRPGLALGLFAITLVTTAWAGMQIAGSTPADFQANPGLLRQGIPYALALMTILGVHEMGHYLVSRYYRIQTTLPYFIPFPFFLGTFGAFIQMRSPIPNRKSLFDVGIAGPLSGFVATLPLLIWGLAHSEVVPTSDEASLLNFEAFSPGNSLLIGLLTKLALGSAITAEQAIHLHPVAVAACLGLVVTALNLMPVGQLDGGHIVHAMFGQKVGARIGQTARFLMLGLSFVQREFFLWAILLFLIPAVDEPALNDVSELNDQRDFLGLLALAILILIVLPVPPALKSVLF